MVILLTGQPGNGKTLTAFYYLVKHLLANPEAEIVTNIKIFEGKLEGYLRDKGKKGLIDRIRNLEPEETTEFYRWSLAGREWKEDSIGNVIPVKIPNPVIYVIDEAHLYWGARNFQKTSTAVLSYVSQHRHLGDNILLITQHPEQIDKAFRRLVDEYWLMTNLEKRRVVGFKGPAGMFKKSVYFHTPSLLQKPAENERFKIDYELADCYDTTAGKRFGDTVGDTKQKKKGLPFSVAVVALLLATCGVVWLVSKIPNWSQRAVAKMFVAADNAGKGASEKLVNDGASLLGIENALPSNPTNAHSHMGWVTVPYSRKAVRFVDGKTVQYHEIGDEKVWTNLPPQTTTQQQSAPATPLSRAYEPMRPEMAIANPQAVVGDRVVTLRMWDGTTRLIRIKSNGDFDAATFGDGRETGTHEETGEAFGNGLPVR